MKGPGIRLDLDVRREWECPECKQRRRVSGETVSVRCRCTRDGAHMKLVEAQRLTRSFAEVIERVQQASQPKDKKPKAAEDLTTQDEPTAVGDTVENDPSPTVTPSPADDA